MALHKHAAVKMFAAVTTGYIKFVYKTSKIIVHGDMGFHSNPGASDERYIICFWHGESYCFYPLLGDIGITIITTETRRGAYISELARRFGYKPIRVPDDTNGDGSFSIKNVINAVKGEHVAISLDGPYGPRHEPKRFPIVTSLVTKKKIQLLSVDVRRGLRVKWRWDKFVIPLPYNTMTFTFHEPFNVSKNEIEGIPEKILKIVNITPGAP